MTLWSVDPLRPLNLRHQLASGLVAHWMPLPHAAYRSGVARDLLRVNPGLLGGNVTWRPPDRPGSGGSWDHASGRITCTDSGLPSGATPRTLLLWVRVQSYAALATVFEYGTNVSGQRFVLRTDAVGGINIAFNGAIYGTSSYPAAGEWARIAITTGANCSDTAIWINGVSCSVALTSGSDRAVNTVLNGSAFIGSSSYLGETDDVRIYNRALSTAEFALDFQISCRGNPGLLNFQYDSPWASRGDFLGE